MFSIVYKGLMEVTKSIPENLINNYLLWLMRTLEIDDVQEVLEKTVTKDGKVGGLLRYAGRDVLIVVVRETKKR
jgi:hypothetical protein